MFYIVSSVKYQAATLNINGWLWVWQGNTMVCAVTMRAKESV
jgi:hypothetical protein